ncbi:PQQ-binding-like beta-propeller repeat protein [Azohydromonas caseinilytica]|uniref:PQQ-binding-like beta-propeller repeat protein n=1 Tax=Azohydromonas caseinilytica TaxID=2728836 RepID=A0A848FB74_9BURK|nr:PQQ-binding-like beta-propeller repeat protein [Azohydromonas caseinilytica]NML16582.1 PQQ-binding-like beta-propeller repeat protein [Azohydromonas caseinilytica]
MLLTGLAVFPAMAAQVLASRNNNARTGANLYEQRLSAANVNPRQFGHLFSQEVEGNIYAQPLVATDVKTGGGLRNIVYVATTDNLVYAFDADGTGRSRGFIWARRLGDPPGANPAAKVTVPLGGLLLPSIPNRAPRVGPVPWNDPAHFRNNATTFMGNVGVIGTPVIDRGRNAIYLVSRTKAGAQYVQTLHALDLSTGNQKPGSPVVLARDTSRTSFAAFMNQRTGLAIANDRLIVAWGSPGTGEDVNRYSGYVMAFNLDTLGRSGCFATGTRLGGGIGFWQAGRAPVVDGAGRVYLFSGNGGPRAADPVNLCTADGSFPAAPPLGVYLSNALLQLDFRRPQPLLHQALAPNQEALDVCDVDLGGSGPLLVPGTGTMVGGGKQGLLHVFSRSADGRHELTQTVQAYAGPPEYFGIRVDDQGVKRCARRGQPEAQGAHHIMGGPVYWESPVHGPLLYLSPESEYIQAFRFDKARSQLAPDPVMRSAAPVLRHPGAILSLSANGSQQGSGILWAVQGDRKVDSPEDPWIEQIRGVVRAFDADDLSRELWNSKQSDGPEFNFAKFTPVTVANGKVYVPTFSGKLIVYGLKP